MAEAIRQRDQSEGGRDREGEGIEGREIRKRVRGRRDEKKSE